MSQKRLEIKVGLFVLLCMALVAGLLIQFSKGSTFFHNTYSIILKAGNVGGLRARATVLMSGVQVGTVAQTLLAPEGTNVSIYLKIYKQYVIRDDARFVIEQSGFLGDQYVAIYPGENKGNVLTNNSVMHAQEPFNMQEVARSAAGFIQRSDDTVKKLNNAIDDVRRLVLNEQTLTNLSYAISTFKKVSDDAESMVTNLNSVVTSNAVPIAFAVSNLVTITEHLDALSLSAQGILNTNEPQINAALSNLRASTATLSNLLAEVQAGKGLAGAVLKNQALAESVASLAGNLSITSSNLNRLGLWHFLWYKNKPPETNSAPAPIIHLPPSR
ncbi:MAG: Mammalian cell entry related domain protein [Pedosphaera sp.]|nr:Mammalian cell entry related domain protein [Pedosphaera sp.]